VKRPLRNANATKGIIQLIQVIKIHVKNYMQLDLNENCDKQEASWISERLDAATYDARLQQVSLV
jgi:hypothetical protein